jgi:hypothetical protein
MRRSKLPLETRREIGQQLFVERADAGGPIADVWRALADLVDRASIADEGALGAHLAGAACDRIEGRQTSERRARTRG